MHPWGFCPLQAPERKEALIEALLVPDTSLCTKAVFLHKYYTELLLVSPLSRFSNHLSFNIHNFHCLFCLEYVFLTIA